MGGEGRLPSENLSGKVVREPEAPWALRPLLRVLAPGPSTFSARLRGLDVLPLREGLLLVSPRAQAGS